MYNICFVLQTATMFRQTSITLIKAMTKTKTDREKKLDFGKVNIVSRDFYLDAAQIPRKTGRWISNVR